MKTKAIALGLAVVLLASLAGWETRRPDQLPRQPIRVRLTYQGIGR